jgi:hypothetical protein
MQISFIKHLLEKNNENTDLDKKTREASDGAVGPSKDKSKKVVDPAKDKPKKEGGLQKADTERNDDGSLKAEVPTNGKTLTGEPANKIDMDPTTIDKMNVTEAKSSCAVVTFGRMNPPTLGHEHLVDQVCSIAKKKQATPLVFLSRSEDKKKNPIPYLKKLQFARRAFGSIVQPTPKDASSIFGILKHLETQYHDVILVVGSDRVDELAEKVKKYNGTEFHFDSIKVVSAGTRDPDDAGVAGASASSLRKLAAAGDEEAFVLGLPEKLRGIGKQVFKATRISEGVDMVVSLTVKNLFEVVDFNRENRVVADYELSEAEIRSLHEKADESGFPVDVIVESYKRGINSWTLTETILDHQQFAFNRVNAMLNGGSNLDDDLFEGFVGDIDVPIQVAQPNRNDTKGKHRNPVKPGKVNKVQQIRKIIENIKEDSVPGIKDGKGVRRIDMPQINDFDAFVKDLQAHGSPLVEPRSYKASDLSPLQKHFNQKKVDLMKQQKDRKPIIISSDNKIIDGHHRWMASKQEGSAISARKVGMKHVDLMDFLKDKPYVGAKKLHEDVYANAAAHKLIANAHGKDSREHHYHMAHHHQLVGEWHRQNGRITAAERSFAKADLHRDAIRSNTDI